MRHQIPRVIIIDGPHKGHVFKEMPIDHVMRCFQLANPLAALDVVGNADIPFYVEYYIYEYMFSTERVCVATPNNTESTASLARLLVDYVMTDWSRFKFGV